jgi:hypothetical protein
MDEIFGELENFSGINIAFDVVVTLDKSNESFRLVSVSGFRYPRQFKATLNLDLNSTFSISELLKMMLSPIPRSPGQLRF